ncbi:MAG: Asp-tRNA(Asn)/Glu-tRNA(Gln) amidotransferase subunit GatB, partial [Actinobacteria bacterium]|nr:Asp-tRNA(Asn)/Glu-tRNA(Gln) amidotransferase subunit GatB [Actinomycetota bacterium]
YFPEPDLVPLDPGSEWIDRVRAGLPPLPAERRAMLQALTGYDPQSEAVIVAVERGQHDYVKAIADAGGDPVRALIYVTQAFAEAGENPSVPPADVAALTVLERDGKLSATQAKTVLAEIVANGGGDAAAIAASKGFEAMDTSAVEAMVDEAIAADPDAWAKYCAGEEKAAGAIVGRVMKASKGKADGKVVSAIMQSRRG